MITMYDAGNYFIHLYDKIDGCYGCSQIKLEKMLILAQVEYYLQSKADLINDINIIFSETHGFSIDTSDNYFRTPITISSDFSDEPLSEEDIKKTETFMQSKIFRFNETDLDPDSVIFLRNIFCKYASFDPRTLDRILNKIKETPSFDKLLNEKNKDSFDVSLELFHEMIAESGLSEDDMKVYYFEQLAKWGRNYLLSNTDLNRAVIDAKFGDISARAALAIMSNSGLYLSEDGFPTISNTRALACVKDGVNAPYTILYKVTSKTEHTDDGIKLTPAYELTIFIDRKYNISYSSPAKLSVETDLDNWQL